MPNIYIADLRHNYQGVISTDAMPLAAGFLKATLDHFLPDVKSQAFAYPDELLDAISEKAPDALLLTNYLWNQALNLHFAKLVKTQNPDCLTIFGGPNIPIEPERQIAFMERHPEIDIYCTGEGEFWTVDVLEKFCTDLSISNLKKQALHSAVYAFDGQLTSTPVKPRSRNLDEIPSPWLTGVMDPFFDGKLAPLWETNRGCPFTCTFCVQGTRWYTKVNYFSLDRIREEIDYIGRMIQTKCPDQKVLRIADPNFGMYKRDIQISEWLGEAQENYDWPLLIDATTGKNQAENIISSIEKVNGALALYQAVQSLDTAVLTEVKRKNIKLETYEQIQLHVQGRGLRSSSDLILGLPGESLESHLQSLQKLINAGTNKLNNFQAMLLRGSELETTESREKYGFQSRFRMLPKNFGVYGGEKVIGFEEIIVATDKLPFGDYLKAREFHLAISLFWNESRFKEVVNLCKEHGLDAWQWLLAVVEEAKTTPDVSLLFQQFLAETQAELFESEQSASTYYLMAKNWKDLESNRVGDNLVYKYRALGIFYHWDAIARVGIKAAKNLLEELTPYPDQFWKDLEAYFIQRFAHGKTSGAVFSESSSLFHFNIPTWLSEGQETALDPYFYQKPTNIGFSLAESDKNYLRAAIEIWGYQPETFSMLVKRVRDKWLCRRAQLIR